MSWLNFRRERVISVFILLGFFSGGLVIAIWLYMNMQVKSYAKYWESKRDEEGEIVYVALGDSSAQGIGASRAENSYVGVFAERVEKKIRKKVKIINLSKSGGTTENVLKEQLVYLQHLKPDIVTISVGTNDIYDGLPEQKLIENLESILNKLPRKSLIAEIPYLMRGDLDRIGKAVNEKLTELSLQKDLLPVPLYEPTKTIHFRWDTYAPDWFHPNDKGYQVWSDSFWKVYELNL